MFVKLKNKGGFTLGELLVVVAIIGVLVAVSIPVFTGQIEKSRDAVTIANLRSAYAQAQTAYMTEESSKDVEYKNSQGGALADSEAMVTVHNVVAKGKKDNNFSGLAENLPFYKFHFGLNGEQLIIWPLDNGGANDYKISKVEFKYNDKGELYLVQVFPEN